MKTINKIMGIKILRPITIPVATAILITYACVVYLFNLEELY